MSTQRTFRLLLDGHQNDGKKIVAKSPIAAARKFFKQVEEEYDEVDFQIQEVKTDGQVVRPRLYRGTAEHNGKKKTLTVKSIALGKQKLSKVEDDLPPVVPRKVVPSRP